MFEAIILPNGVVIAAIASHEEELTKAGMQKLGLSREEYELRYPILDDVPYINWAVDDTGCVAVWPGGYLLPPNVTEEQRKAIRQLVRKRLIKNRVIERNDK